MRKLKKTGNSSQSARNVETRCSYTMELTNLISGSVTAWPAGTRDMSGKQEPSGVVWRIKDMPTGNSRPA